MSEVKLIGVAASRALRNIWMLKELGLAYVHDPIHYTDPALKQPPYIDWNPNGAIPMILVDGTTLFESLAINLFLAEKFPSELSAKTAEERGQLAQWSLWAATSVETDLGNWAYHTMFLPEAERRPDFAKESLAKALIRLDVLEKVLSSRQYLLGDRFTVADLNVAAVCYRAIGIDMPDKPLFKAWLNRSWSRPAAIEARRARGDQV